MLQKEVKEWLSEYKRLTDSEIHSFACTLGTNEELISSLFVLFETPPFYVQELDPVCHQLFEFYRSKEEGLQLFALSFLPALLWLYLRCLSLGENEVCGGVETFLLGVYNLEIVKPDGSPAIQTFRVPVLGKPSVYHDTRQSGSGSEALTEKALRQLNTSPAVWRGGPFPQHESFNAQNRFSILSFLMQCYCHHMDRFHLLSLASVCKATSRIVSTGFGSPRDAWSKQPRLAVHPSLLVEMLMAVFFAMFNGNQKEAVRALEMTHDRANYELYSDVLLVTNGLLNSLKRGNLQVKEDVPPTGSKLKQTRRSTITNASFKATKLPDDIEITVEEGSKLSTVEEDGEHSVAKNLKAKLLNIGGKLGVDRNKNRDASSARRDSDTGSVKSSGYEVHDSVGVAVIKGSPSTRGSVLVDVLELQPLKNGRGRGTSSHEQDGIDELDTGELCMVESNPSPSVKGTEEKERGRSTSLIFSKKSGFVKSGSSPGSGSSTPISSQHSESSNKHSCTSNTRHSSPAISSYFPNSNVTPSSNGVSLSISSDGVGSTPASSSSSKHKHSSAQRASSEGRVIDQSTHPSTVVLKEKHGKIQVSNSESNIPPSSSSASSPSTSSQASSHVMSQSTSQEAVSRKMKHDKKAGHVNSTSFSTDL